MTNTDRTFANKTSGSYLKPMLIGGGFALALMILFISGVDNPDPSWGEYWMIRPLIVVTLAGATGGAIFNFLMSQNYSGWGKTVAMIAGFVIYVIGLWMGSVLGLAGTLWN